MVKDKALVTVVCPTCKATLDILPGSEATCSHAARGMDWLIPAVMVVRATDSDGEQSDG